MRLTCPSCAMAYEVADGLIGPGGRHVQCTACHMRWFERPQAASVAERLGEDEIIARLETRGRSPRAATEPTPAVRKTAPTTPVAPVQSGRDFLWEERRAEAGPEAARSGPSHLRLVEPQEAAQETAPDIAASAEPPAEAVSAADGSEPAPQEEERAVAPADAEAMAAVSERPAPQETDAAAPDAPAPYPAAAHSRRRGGMGIWLGLGIVVLALGVYLAAGPIARAVPDAAPALDAFTGAIDEGRLRIAEAFRDLLAGR